MEDEAAPAPLRGVLLEDVAPRDVARQQVGRELEPPEREAEQRRERLHQPGLAEPRQPLEQDVAAREAGGDDLPGQLALSEQHAVEAGDEGAGERAAGLELGGREQGGLAHLFSPPPAGAKKRLTASRWAGAMRR